MYPVKITGVGGHRLLATNYSLDGNPFIFSFLRSPNSRFISHLNWQITKMRRNWTVETFAQNQYFNNYQCMRICGTRDASAAIDVINNVFSFVGLLEHYDESLVLMKFLLGDDSFDNRYEPVSYTHLTLPTKRIV